MNNIKLNSFFSLVLTAIAVILTSSWLQGNFTILSRGWLWLGLGCIVCVFLYPAYLKQKNIFWLIAYATIVVFNFLMGDAYFYSTANVIMELAMLLFCSYFAFYVANNYGSIKLINIFVYSQIIVIVATSVLSIAIDMLYPGVIRETVTLINAGYSGEAVPFYRMGVCEYGFPHGIPMILPGLVLLYKNRRLKLIYRLLILMVLALLFYLVFVSGITTSLILAIFGIIASLIIREGGLKKNITRLAILSLFLTPLLSDTVMLNVLKRAEQIVPEENKITGKIINFEETIQNENSADGSIQMRGTLYGMSIDAFLTNPILGTNSKSFGGHSALLDRFASLGLIGGVPFILFIIALYKLVRRALPKNSILFFYIGLAGFMIMLATKNMSNIYVWLYSICLLPALILFNANPPKFLLRH